MGSESACPANSTLLSDWRNAVAISAIIGWADGLMRLSPELKRTVCRSVISSPRDSSCASRPCCFRRSAVRASPSASPAALLCAARFQKPCVSPRDLSVRARFEDPFRKNRSSIFGRYNSSAAKPRRLTRAHSVICSISASGSASDAARRSKQRRAE